MSKQSFSAALAETFPRAPDPDDLASIQKQPAELLNWVLARVLLDEDVPAGAAAWFDAQVAWLEKRRLKPLSAVTTWSSVAATALLLGRSADEHAERAVDAVLPASKQNGSELEVLELTSCAIALNMYYGHEKGIRAWREARYEQRFPKDTEPSAFHMLFLSGPEAAGEPLERLVLETAHVSFRVMTRLTHQFVAPLVLALEARATTEDKGIVELLRGAAGRLGEAVFGPSRDPAAGFVIHDTAFDIVERRRRNVLRAAVSMEGRGRLLVGPVLILPLTAEFTGRLVDFIESTIDPATAKRLAAAITKPKGLIEGVLSYDPAAVTVEETEQSALRTRFQVAFTHAKRVIEGLRCSGNLVFEGLPASGEAGRS